MSETTDWLDECMGLYTPHVQCPHHKIWHIDNEWGCPECEYEMEEAAEMNDE